MNVFMFHQLTQYIKFGIYFKTDKNRLETLSSKHAAQLVGAEIYMHLESSLLAVSKQCAVGMDCVFKKG